MSNSLLIIDPQNDFCLPGSPLYVNGADADMHRLANLLVTHPDKVDSIYISLDMHNIEDIAHPNYWVKWNEGKPTHPEPFTNITFEDVKSGKWVPKNTKDDSIALEYLKTIEEKKKFTHTIWPVHCVAGTYGSNIFPTLNAGLKKWTNSTNQNFKSYIKGMDRNSEHFGIFQSEDGKSEFNYELLDEFKGCERILVAGQAKSHCVATTLKQILDIRPNYIKKTILLTDTTSNVPGCENIADGIYNELREAGMKEMTTIDYIIKIEKEREY